MIVIPYVCGQWEAQMLGEQRTEQYEFFAGSLRDLIPDDHVLARVSRVLDLSWLADEVSNLYCLDNGRPGIVPETAVRLMLAGFLVGIVHDRKLMREAPVNVTIRWFCGFGLTERLPDHSSLARIRQRWARNASAESSSARSRPASQPRSPRERSSISTLR